MISESLNGSPKTVKILREALVMWHKRKLTDQMVRREGMSSIKRLTVATSRD